MLTLDAEIGHDRVLLLENIHPDAATRLSKAGYQVETRAGALDEDELIAAIRDVQVLGIRSGTQITERVSWDQGTLTHEPQVLGQSAHLWSRTSMRPADVDVALMYDGFTFNAISWIEALGFCGIGEAMDWLDGGRRIALDGELPINPHGGQLSEGRTHGFGFIYEAMAQLRHDAGERQVANAQTAVVTSGGGTPSGVMLLRRP